MSKRILYKMHFIERMKHVRRAYSNYKVKLGFIHIEIFIATMAMFFTANQAFLMSQQNKSSVMPWVDIKISTSDEKSLIKIENSGIGPAILHGMRVIDLDTGDEIINISEFENKLRKVWEDQTEHQLKVSSRIFEENQDSSETKELYKNLVENIERNKENYRTSLKQCSDVNPKSALRIGDSIELIRVGSLTGIS